MLLEKLFYYLQGYLILELCGESKERFINLCKNREIEIIQIFLINEKWYCKIKYRDFFKLKMIKKKTGCLCKIQEKRGFPFLCRKIKARKGFVFGCLLFLLIISQCSGRIWYIGVEGGFLHTREQILQVMQSELGIYGGVFGKQVDCFEIEKRLRLDYNEIGWISVEKRGCCLFVMLNESNMPSEKVTREEPSHIIAEQDGIVRKIEVMKGIPQVKIGDEVKKGDILISGIVPIIGDFEEVLRMDPVVAEGKVWLESNFTYNARHSMVYEKKNFKTERLGLQFFLFGHKLFSYIPRYSEGKYDIMSIDIVPYAFKDYQAPVLFRKYRLMQYDTELIQMTEAEVKDKVKVAWEKFLNDWKSQGVVVCTADFSAEIRQKICYVTGTVTALGNFISYQEIQEEEWKIEDEHSGNNP